MAAPFLHRASSVQARFTIPLLIFPMLVYVVTWNWEPYAFGYAVLLLAPVQFVWALAGIPFAVMGSSSRAKLVSSLINAALAGSSVGAFAVLRMVHWG